MNYENDMYIDEESLEQEWLDQATLARKYGKHWARCREKLTLAEENIKVIRAELIKEVNDDPEGCLGEDTKATGPNVEAYYRTHEKHLAAKTAWVKAQFKANNAEIAYKEISFTRKVALENLVKLFQSEYFAGPSIPRNISEEREARQTRRKETQSNIGKNLQRTTKK